MQTRSLVLHAGGPALWPQHKPLAEVLTLKETTPPLIWEGTYQGNPTPPGGHTFKRTWWRHTRYHMREHLELPAAAIWARYQSWDTGSKTDPENAFTACTTAELLTEPLYALRVTRVWRERLEFSDLPDAIRDAAILGNRDGKLRAVVIEDKGSGISALQTLRAGAERWLARLLVPYLPTLDKVMRADQAATWCKNGSVWLPSPDATGLVPWLLDFEDELFNFPQSAFLDQVDSFSQLVIFLENLIAEGFHARAHA